MARMDVPGRWAGGFRAWDAEGVYLATGRGPVAGPRAARAGRRCCAIAAHAWFPFGSHLIEGLYRTARSIESTRPAARARWSPSGTLAAGLAHEINNPAAAATRAVDALRGQPSDAVLSSLGRLADEDISPQQFVALDDLRQELEPRHR